MIRPVLAFAVLLTAFWLAAVQFGVMEQLGGHAWPAFLSFALLLAPYWAFGFKFDEFLRRRLKTRAQRLAAAVLLIVPYLVFAVPRGEFRWELCAGLTAAILAIALLLEYGRVYLPLAAVALIIELHVFDAAWPVAGLRGMAKLLFLDVVLFGYLVIRPIGGIGFDFRPRLSDALIGLREFLFYTPIALALGFAMGFLHLHRTHGSINEFLAGWLFTLFFIALPEELFFRGLLLNLLERRIGPRAALGVTSVLFGLAHFNKRAATFNWRYVILAAIAGFFYGRSWLARRRLLSAGITHATVDTVWSIWLR